MCYYFKGHLIPGCWPSVVYGEGHCSCERAPRMVMTVLPSGYLFFPQGSTK